MTCTIDLFKGSPETIAEGDQEECDIDETDEGRDGVAEVKTVRQLNFKPRFEGKGGNKGMSKFPIKKQSGLHLMKHQSEDTSVMPHMNFFLEKKRKHEEEFSISTLNSNQSDRAYQTTPKKTKKRVYKGANTFNDEDLEIDESLTEQKLKASD